MIRAWLGLLSLLAAPVAPAGEILDDSASPRQQFELRLSWARIDPFSDDIAAVNRVIGHVDDVEVRLDTSAYVGRRARIFLMLPDLISGLDSTEGVTLRWRARGDFLAGHTTPGQRALLFEGVIEDEVTSDVLSYTLELDARHLTGVLRLEPVFEIEVEP